MSRVAWPPVLCPLVMSIEEQVILTLYWQAQQETGVSYKVFVRLLDANGQILLD